jgi:hypothetical protein
MTITLDVHMILSFLNTMLYLYSMHLVLCYLRKDIIWNGRTINNKKEIK